MNEFKQLSEDLKNAGMHNAAEIANLLDKQIETMRVTHQAHEANGMGWNGWRIDRIRAEVNSLAMSPMFARGDNRARITKQQALTVMQAIIELHDM